MADQTPTSKKLIEKQQRRAAEEERRRQQQKAARRRNLVTLMIAVVVLAVVIALVLQNREGAPELKTVGADKAGCTDVETHEIEGQEHVEVTPEYGTNPPTSGNHLQTPAAPGFYDEPLDPGTLVHNMEHGQIVFWYDPDAPQDTLDSIEAVVDQEPQATVGAPWPEPESGYTFAMTAWGASQKCREVSQDVVNAFREQFQGKGPENVGVPTFEAPNE